MKVVRPIVIAVLLCCAFAVHAQAPNWQWATGPAGQSTVISTCTDANGNAYITGHYMGHLLFGADSITDNIGPYQDVFIAKYDPSGNALWAKNGNGYADAFGISADANGNVYMVGNFYNATITFANNVLINPNPGAQVSNIFLVKYDSLGNLLWAKNLGGINNDEALGISTDANGNVYITGNFTGDSLSINNITLQHLGSNDVFVAKFNSSGVAQWIKSIGSPFIDGAAAVCTDIKGNIFITGYFEGANLFLGNTTNYIASPYSYNIFITKYDSSGNMRWTQYAGGNYGNGSTGISADALGNVYVTGYYSDSLAFGNSNITGMGYQNIFTAKYDTSGALLWAKSAGGRVIDQANGIITDLDGNSYITGYFQSDTAIFGNNQLLNGTGNQFTFIAKYDASGNNLWALAPGGTSNNVGAAISYSEGSVYTAGTFQSSNIIFGNNTLSAAQLNSFLAKLDSSTLTDIEPINNQTGKVSVYPNPSNGNFYFNRIVSGNKIEVFNLLGESICKVTADRNNFPVNLNGVAKGIYLYRVTDETGIAIGTGKIAIQ